MGPRRYARVRSTRRIAVVVLAAALALLGSDGAGTPWRPATATAATATIVRETPLTLLARLRVAAERTTGYDRATFVHWIDADRDGCNTRREVLIAEAVRTPAIGSSCALVGGSWRSAYDGVTTADSGTFDVDHLVPLKEAHDSGAWAWDLARRRAFANDLGDFRALRAVTASSNRSKGDKDPAAWLPPLASFRCTYAREWVAVKVRWRLSVDRAERDALRRILGGCTAPLTSVAILPAPTGTAPAPSGAPSAAPTAVAGCDPNYAGWCVPLSTTDLDCPDVGHRVTVIGVDIHRLDSDGDGIGCDSYPG